MLLHAGLNFGRILLVGVDVAVELVFAHDLQRHSGAQLALAEALAGDRTCHDGDLAQATLGVNSQKCHGCNAPSLRHDAPMQNIAF